MLPQWLAWTIISTLTGGGIGWTVFCLSNPEWGEGWTTSWLLKNAQHKCDQVSSLLLLLMLGLLNDALPGVSLWLKIVMVIAIYALGHGLWALPGFF